MRLRVLLAAAAGALATACSDGPSSPSGTPATPAQTFQITCPAPVAAESMTGSAVPVTYTPPTITAGKVPVVTTCLPASGTPFVLGSTTVTCTATDGTPKTVACSFPVSVTRPGTLSATRFLAFGDSITEGKLGAVCANGATALETRDFFLRDLARPRVAVNNPTSYPAVLTTQLNGRYSTQFPVATNVGLASERVTDDTWGTNDVTKARLVLEMAAYAPQVVLLLEGVNDLNANATNPSVTFPAVVKGLRDLAREARQRGASQVFIATLLPQRAGACRATSASQIASVNSDIRSMIAAEGHVLVDAYEGFGGIAGNLIDFDGLHPNVAGHQKLAEIFFNKIKERLEVPR